MSSLVVSVILFTSELYQGDHEHYCKQHQGCGRSASELPVPECFLVDVVHEDHGALVDHAVGTSGQHVHDVVDLEAADGQHNRHEEGGGLELRQRHVPELLPGIRPVQGGRLIEVLADALQSGQVDHHVVTHRLPDRKEHDREHDGLGRRGPFERLDMKHVHEQLVHESALAGRKEHVPDCGNRHERCHVGKERDRPEKGPALDLLIEKDRKGQGAHQGQRNGKKAVYYRILQRCHEPVVCKKCRKVAQSDKLHRIGAVPFVKGHDKGQYDGPQRKHRKAYEVRRDERICHQRPLAVSFAEGGLSVYICVAHTYLRFLHLLLFI